MNPKRTYAQNLRLRKIQNRQHNGQDKFSVGPRGAPIPGEIDPVTKARRERRALKRKVNLTQRMTRLERIISKETDGILITSMQKELMNLKQSIAALS